MINCNHWDDLKARMTAFWNANPWTDAAPPSVSGIHGLMLPAAGSYPQPCLPSAFPRTHFHLIDLHERSTPDEAL